MEEEISQTTDSAELDVDKLLADIENPSQEGPTATPEPEAPQWKGEEWEFDWNGKKIVPDSRDKVKTWMSQGYNYSQRMGELNKTHAQRMADAEARERTAQQVESRFKPYVEIDEYARANQDWWNHVQQSFQNREKQGLDPNLAKVLSPIEERLGRFEQFLAQKDQEAEHARVEKEDQALDAEIESTRKLHPNIDLSERDQSGETLERRILMHAQEIGTKSFRAAFRDYLHDKLVVQQSAHTKLQAARDTQAQAKAGLLGRTPAPTKQLKPVDTKRPWNDPQFSVESILEEFRQTGG